ncbi:hypothetical protein LUZ60_006187 [Juncus effusus]|nr:hypothetical protein LUZ60_006187 [Juncus effusus]
MNNMLLSHKAACNSHGQDSSYFLGWQEYEKNPYNPTSNPGGIIQLGLAENQLSFELIESWLESNPDVLSLKHDGVSVFRELALFQDYHGLPSFKNALAEFMSELRGNKVRFEPNKIVLTAGATSANEILMFCLANPGDAFLVPTPYYPGFDRDLKWRTGAEIVPIHCSSSNNFKITKNALEDAYKQAKKLKLQVKGVLVTNPSNPLGTTLTRTELDILVNFISDKKLHLISDEIYSGTCFGSPEFISIAEVVKGCKDDVANQVHIVYSLSKDLGLPGFRIGAIYSSNKGVIDASTKMSSFGLISSQTQYLLAMLLSDKNFTRNYVMENKRRIRDRQERLVEGLERIGISCLDSNAGLFCWVDMRHLLKKNTFKGEMDLWKKIVYEVGLNVSPGSSCHCTEPGWFRLCFANISDETLHVALRRLATFVGSGNYNGKKTKGHVSLAKWVSQLSRANQRAER